MLLLVAGAALVAATAGLLVARVADRNLTQLLLGVYVIGVSEVVLVSLALSAGSELSKTALLGSLLGLLVVAVAAGRRAWPRGLKLPGRELLQSLRNPAVAVVALATTRSSTRT